MKSKNIPEDIRSKSIKEAQNEIEDIIRNLENEETSLENSMDKYNRMMHLNDYIQEQFKKRLKKIRENNLSKKKQTQIRD
tara:strand:- start:608 stop:847 length:240 start_codon:yes stop_codon:yes gene_type:complete